MIDNKLINTDLSFGDGNTNLDEKKLKKIRKMLIDSQKSDIKNMPYLTLKSTDVESETNDGTLSPVTFKANSSLREIMKLLAKIRFNLGDAYYNYGNESPEKMSDLLRNLILEEWERKKSLLLKINNEVKK